MGNSVHDILLVQPKVTDSCIKMIFGIQYSYRTVHRSSFFNLANTLLEMRRWTRPKCQACHIHTLSSLTHTEGKHFYE